MNRLIINLSVGFLLTSFGLLQAATIEAVDSSCGAVQAAIHQASPGDTVIIPSGTATWSNALVIENITLKGSGTNSTILLDAEPYGSPMIIISDPNSGILNNGTFTRLSNLQLADGGGQGGNVGKVRVVGNYGASWRIDHVFFNDLHGDSITMYNDSEACIDHNYVILQSGFVNNEGYANDEGYPGNSSYGDYSYATPPTYGGTNMVYIENNYITNIIPGSSSSPAYDGICGARSVFRYNSIYNTFWSVHGNDTGQRLRGARQYEIYGNYFYDDQGFIVPFDFRGGTGVCFSNTIAGNYSEFSRFDNYRSVDAFAPWGGANGVNPWDSNSPTLYGTFTHTGSASQTFITTNVNWAAGSQWVGYTLIDTNQGQYANIANNGTNTLTQVAVTGHTWSQLVFQPGDTIQIYQVVRTLDQVGSGSGDLLAGDGIPGSPVYNTVTGGQWPRQVIEPLYFWGNTFNGSLAVAASGWPQIQLNRDYYNDTMKPGYTPLVYPHPLDVLDKKLSPPSGLSVQPINP